MKFKLSLLAILLFFSFSAQPQENVEVTTKTIFCGATEIIAKNLSEKYNEIPVIYGMEDESGVVFFMNRTTGSFTIIQVFGNKSCVLSLGEKARLINLNRSNRDLPTF